uniref:Anthranilate phosphoribosyltransferase, chloroplastic-like n=1 Tax=Nelumbo nucifera TaxID=4432 RepID=A0A822YED7_NELNU|nr:TPA_asm: hypothetical protein HUJ06_009741 [Nelumbo nucifera]
MAAVLAGGDGIIVSRSLTNNRPSGRRFRIPKCLFSAPSSQFKYTILKAQATTLPDPYQASNPPIQSFKQLIESLINRQDLSEVEAEASLDFLLKEANGALISAFLVLLRAKGETFEEIVGLARAMLKYSVKVEEVGDAVDIVGTGGDGANTVNISTGASILAAASGANVAKVSRSHSNPHSNDDQFLQ